MANILVLTNGTLGDILPFLRLSNGLLASGHNVTLVTGERNSTKIRETGFKNHKVINLPEFLDWQKDGNKLGTVELFYSYIIENIYRLLEEHNRQPKALLIYHAGFHLAAQMVIDKLLTPSICVYPAPYLMLNVVSQSERYEIYGTAINKRRAEYGLREISDWRGWLESVSCGIGLWPSWFGSQDNITLADFKLTGFISNEKPSEDYLSNDEKRFLGGGPPPVIINHGSSRPINPDFFRVNIEACRLLGRRIFVVTQHEDMIDGCLGRDVMYRKFAHFPSVMPHASAVIHHGGIGTTGQALEAGIPQLFFPYVFDNHDNAARSRQLGVADLVPPFRRRPETIAKTLQRLMTSPSVEQKCKYYADLSLRSAPLIATCEAVDDYIKSVY